MSFELSFTEEFFTGSEETEETDRPTSILEAIENMDYDEKLELTKHCFTNGQHFAAMNYVKTESWAYDVLDLVRKTNSCRNLDSPVEVYIDEDYFFSIHVYD